MNRQLEEDKIKLEDLLRSRSPEVLRVPKMIHLLGIDPESERRKNLVAALSRMHNDPTCGVTRAQHGRYGWMEPVPARRPKVVPPRTRPLDLGVRNTGMTSSLLMSVITFLNDPKIQANLSDEDIHGALSEFASLEKSAQAFMAYLGKYKSGRDAAMERLSIFEEQWEAIATVTRNKISKAHMRRVS